MLSTEQLDSFARRGYLVLPGVVDEERRRRADERIDELIAADPPAAGHVGGFSYWQQSPAGEPALMGPYEQVRPYAETLVAPLTLEPPPHVQVALTFPPHPHRPGGGHVDGLANKGPGDQPYTFTMLAGVILTDQTVEDAGNLYVWPGSHRVIGDHLREHGPETLLRWDSHPPLLFEEPVQVYGAPGDLVLAHYLLSHNGGGNMSSVLRRTLYYRLAVTGHADRWREVVTDPLCEFPFTQAQP